MIVPIPRGQGPTKAKQHVISATEIQSWNKSHNIWLQPQVQHLSCSKQLELRFKVDKTI